MLRAVFDTAAPVERLYAVEMPAAATLAALAASEACDPAHVDAATVDAGAALERLLGDVSGGDVDGREDGEGSGDSRGNVDSPVGSGGVSAAHGGGGQLSDGSAFLWREGTPRLFIGDAGSATCGHVDMVRAPLPKRITSGPDVTPFLTTYVTSVTTVTTVTTVTCMASFLTTYVLPLARLNELRIS